MKLAYTQRPRSFCRNWARRARPVGREAAQRLEKYGPNKLKEAEKPTMLQRFLKQMQDPMLLILLAAAAVSGVTNLISHEPFTEAIIILVVVLLNAALGVFQESKAEGRHRGAADDDRRHLQGAARRAARSPCPASSWCPATSSCWKPATACPPTAACWRAPASRSRKRP